MEDKFKKVSYNIQQIDLRPRKNFIGKKKERERERETMEAKGEVQGNVDHFYYCRKHFLLCLPEYTFRPCQTQELQVTCMRAQPLSYVRLFCDLMDFI